MQKILQEAVNSLGHIKYMITGLESHVGTRVTSKQKGKKKKKKLEAKPRRIRTRTSMSAYDHI